MDGVIDVVLAFGMCVAVVGIVVAVGSFAIPIILGTPVKK